MGDMELHEGVFSSVTRVAIGAAIEVHKSLGPGFPEAVYEEALCLEMTMRGIRHIRQAPVHIKYKGIMVGEGRVDILVEDAVILELKAVDSLLPIHSAQLFSYLRATGLKVGLLINFNVNLLTQGIERLIL
jgi:GxxExxY protein